ncbi:MAG: sugar nucleotide-binding protein [Deltaproteobacteria bacterium]|nr:sugar nucleotide-binding protein [Myxococcales bacterium]MDP3218784.1 sugar nucleotide-binding protein [Deltaproteobacteria bacterium]
MSTLVFGAGFLGRRFARELPLATLSTVDITDRDAVAAAIRGARAEVVINAAGKTGRPNVDWCETHRGPTWRSNVLGALELAEACEAAGAHLVHVGSGCVFYGPSPSPGGWREDDPANPISYYSRSKYAADLLLAPLPHVAVVRIRMPVDAAVHPRNLITKLAGYAQVVDVENSVTVVDDLVGVVAALAARRASGVFHATNPGTLRHRDLLALYRQVVDPSHRCELIGEGELVARGLAAAPRSNCVLASPRLDGLGLAMRPVGVALADVMSRYAADLRARAHQPGA